jgi:hypothetical protein
MKKRIKIFGLPRSGTNLLEHLLPLNFWSEFCLKRDFNDYLGWKHARPKDPSVYNEIEKITWEELFFIFSIRDKKEWIETIKQKHWESFEMPWDFKNSSRFVFNTPHGPEIYRDPEEYYDRQIKSYFDFFQKNEKNSLIVNYNDFKQDQTKVLEKIEQKFQLERCQPNWTTINKKINWSGQIVNELA